MMITCSIVLDHGPYAKAKVVVSAGSAIYDVMAFQAVLERLSKSISVYLTRDLISADGKSDVILECEVDAMMVASLFFNSKPA